MAKQDWKPESLKASTDWAKRDGRKEIGKPLCEDITTILSIRIGDGYTMSARGDLSICVHVLTIQRIKVAHFCSQYAERRVDNQNLSLYSRTPSSGIAHLGSTVIIEFPSISASCRSISHSRRDRTSATGHGPHIDFHVYLGLVQGRAVQREN